MSKTYFEQMRELMENAETWMLFIPDLFDKADKQIERLETENKKLRELVKHLYECARHNTCAVCEYADDACDFDYDMRELGVGA